jgi:hypothetical protein
MANGLAQALATLAQSFSIQVIPTAGASSTFQALLVSPNLKRGLLQVVDSETVTQLVQSTIDLSWLTKNVRFVDPDITHANVLGGLPINDLLAVNVATVTNGAPAPPGVPGLLGAIQGTVQIPMDVTQSVSLDVQISARWTVTDEQGNMVGSQDLSWTVTNPNTSTVDQQGSGGSITIAPDLALEILNLAFNVLFVEAVQFDGTTFPAPIAKRTLEASIQLTAGPASSGWVNLPPLELSLAVIPIPTILLLFENASFTDPGVGLIMVPANSPLDSTTITAALNALDNTLSPLQASLAVLSFVLGEIAPGATVQTALGLAQNARLTFQKTDGISDLSNIEWKSHWYGDEDAEDNISSIIMIGPPGRQAQCFNGRDFAGSAEGQMNINIGSELLVEVPNLHSAFPASNPVGHVTVPFAPTGWRWAHTISIFGDEFSSIQFAWVS